MSKFKLIETGIEGMVIIEPQIFSDNRGYFMETWNRREFHDIGLDMDFVQDNQSCSSKGVLRGLHYQTQHAQGKLVRVLQGEVYDVGVDLRPDSLTFCKWYGVYLNDENRKLFYVPPGFAHGFVVLSDRTVFAYKCTDFYYPEYDRGIMYNDPVLAVHWPMNDLQELIISDKDKKLPQFADTPLAKGYM